MAVFPSLFCNVIGLKLTYKKTLTYFLVVILWFLPYGCFPLLVLELNDICVVPGVTAQEAAEHDPDTATRLYSEGDVCAMYHADPLLFEVVIVVGVVTELSHAWNRERKEL